MYTFKVHMILHFVRQNKQTRRIADFVWFWNDVSAQETNIKPRSTANQSVK